MVIYRDCVQSGRRTKGRKSPRPVASPVPASAVLPAAPADVAAVVWKQALEPLVPLARSLFRTVSAAVRGRDPLADTLQRFGLERDRLRAAPARQTGISQTNLDALEHLKAAGTRRPARSLCSSAVTMLAGRLERAG